MKTFLFLVFVLGTVFDSPGQTPFNYVPNPSFELMDSCPDWDGQVNRLKQWYNPTYNTPDFFNVCATSNVCAVPENAIGFQFARTGSGYVGIATNFVNSREYIGVKLKQELNADTTYCVSFWVSKAEKAGYACGGLGIHFSANKLHTYADSGFSSVLDVIPQVFYPIDQHIVDSTNWIEVNGSFVAQGGEQYITIGNFFNDAALSFLLVNQSTIFTNWTYYYIDDVSVKACNPTSVSTISHQASIKLYPNPADNEVVVYNGAGEGARMVAHDVLGRMVADIVLVRGSNAVSTAGWPAGAYIVKVTYKEEPVCRHRVVIARP